MLLYYAPTSPYARKVRVVAREKGLAGEIEEVAVNPLEDPPELEMANPLGKVPALLLDHGAGLYDSAVICDYLDELGDGSRLIPAEGEARLATLRAQALADGIMDLAVPLTHESRRRVGERSPAAMERWRRQIDRGVGAMGRTLASLVEVGPDSVELGQIACACALAYLDFRHPDSDWRRDRLEVAAWYAGFAERTSMTATRPPDGA